MSRIIAQNAFNLLGLPTNASDNQILSRSREIQNRLKIDDIPVYDTDINIISIVRDEKAVKDSAQILQQNQRRIIEGFFWFSGQGAENLDAIEKLQNNNHMLAKRIWQNAVSSEPDNLSYQKNLAVINTLLEIKQHDITYHKDALQYWQKLILSEDFEKFLSEEIWMNYGISINHDLVLSVKNEIRLVLADIYSDLYEQHKVHLIISDYVDVFHETGHKFQKKVLEPIFISMNNASTLLEEMDISQDDIFSSEEKNLVTKTIQQIDKDLKELAQFGLIEDGRVVTLRDSISNSINKICLDLHNNLSETAVAVELMKKAKLIAGTGTSRLKYDQNVKKLSDQLTIKELNEEINRLWENKQFEDGITYIKVQRKKHTSADLKEFLDEQEKNMVVFWAFEKNILADKHYSNNEWRRAEEIYSEAEFILAQNLQLYDLTRVKYNNLITMIKADINILSTFNAEKVDNHRKDIINKIRSVYDNKPELIFLKVQIDCMYSKGFIQLFRRVNPSRERLYYPTQTLVHTTPNKPVSTTTPTKSPAPQSTSTSSGCTGTIAFLFLLWLFLQAFGN